MNLRPIEFVIDAFMGGDDMPTAPNSLTLTEFIQQQESIYQKVLAKFGNTQVLCSVFIQGGMKYVPEHAKQKNQGWLTAEYQMLPHATQTRQKREARGQISGRSQEIQRLIGRSLRAALDLSAMQGLNIVVDCDVLHADGGTRTTAINGSFLALALALKKLSMHFNTPELLNNILKKQIAAISVGILESLEGDTNIQENIKENIKDDVKYILDLNYAQDSKALVDANVILAMDSTLNISLNSEIFTNDNAEKNIKKTYEIVEIQASAEGRTFSFNQLQKIIELAQIGIEEIQSKQEQFLR